MTFTSKEWEPLQKGITKVFNIVEGKEPNFTSQEYIKLYTIVYNMCNKDIMPISSREVSGKYKEILEDYIISKVLPSLQEKKDDLLLRELFKRWSDYKAITSRLSFFSNAQFIRSLEGISVEAVNFSAFNKGVYEKMTKEIMDAIFSVIDRKVAGEMSDQTFVINTLDFYLNFYKCTKKKVAEVQRMNRSKKINLISSDGTVFEIDYGVALMSKRFEDITETISAGDDVDAICIHKVSSKILTMIVDYCKEGDVKFVDADPRTLLDLTTSACYMKIESLEKLAWSKVSELIKGKTPEEIAQIFGDADDSNSKLLEENVQKMESLEM
ncbi:cullin-1-like [Vicia villosa]|uniref:cullin-1-like n=1 Tax=Vicia villosa TaxID=3911 RepID=UPI00273B2544|nr:cullin-1-like [Vicia villosa]